MLKDAEPVRPVKAGMEDGSGGQRRDRVTMRIWELLATRFEREDGATMVEYAIMLVLIAAISMAIITTIGLDVRGLFESADF